jgi:hypothetical protein
MTTKLDKALAALLDAANNEDATTEAVIVHSKTAPHRH